MTKNQKLKNIRKKVAETHWTKGCYCRRIENKVYYCLAGHINVETSGDPYEWGDNSGKIYNLVWGQITKLYPGTLAECIEEWNDRSRTTRTDVLEVLDRAIEETS